MHRLPGHRLLFALSHAHGELVEGRLAGDDRLEYPQHESLRGKLRAVAYNQFGFSCERIQPGEESFRAVGKLGTRDGFEHTELADLLSMSMEKRSFPDLFR